MVSGVPTASGYEERIQFSEMEVVDRGANEQGLLANMPEGHSIYGWDVNVAAVRVASIRRTVRHHQHAVSFWNPSIIKKKLYILTMPQEFVIRVRRDGQAEHFVGKRYGDFVKLHKQLQTELPGKPLPVLPRKNKTSTSSSWFSYSYGNADDDAASSISSSSTLETGNSSEEQRASRTLAPGSFPHHGRSASRSSGRSSLGKAPRSPKQSAEGSGDKLLYREEQRVSLRAFLRTILQQKRIAESKALKDFLNEGVISLTEEDQADIKRRKEVDGVRIEEQKRFYEIARQRAAELDVYMENFRRDIVESSEFLSG